MNIITYNCRRFIDLVIFFINSIIKYYIKLKLNYSSNYQIINTKI